VKKSQKMRRPIVIQKTASREKKTQSRYLTLSAPRASPRLNSTPNSCTSVGPSKRLVDFSPHRSPTPAIKDGTAAFASLTFWAEYEHFFRFCQSRMKIEGGWGDGSMRLSQMAVIRRLGKASRLRVIHSPF